MKEPQSHSWRNWFKNTTAFSSRILSFYLSTSMKWTWKSSRRLRRELAQFFEVFAIVATSLP